MFMSGIMSYAVGLFANTMLGDWTESHMGASLGHFKPQLLMNTTFNIKFSISGIKFPEKKKVLKRREVPWAPLQNDIKA